jgi:uncharacterized alkaline shock family protein YloU
MTEVDPDAVASAALACPEVAGVSGGLVGEVATYLPGRSVAGVRVTEDEVEIHIVARWREDLPKVADAVRAAVKPYTGSLPTAVYVEDIEMPEDSHSPVDQGVGGGAGP